MDAAHWRVAGTASLAVGALACLVPLRLALGDEGLVLDAALAVLAGAAMFRASRLARAGRSRRAWRLQMAFAFVWAIAAVVLQLNGPEVVVALLRVTAIASAILGWWFTSYAVDPWSRVRLAIAGGLAAGSVFVVVWVPLLRAAWHGANSTGAGVVALGVPLAAVAVAVFVAGLALTEMRGRHRVMPAFVVAGLSLLSWSDTAWAMGATPLWAVGWALLVLGTFAYRGTSGRRDVISTQAMLTYSPYVLVAPAAATLVWQWARGAVPGPEVKAGLVLVALLLARQHVTLVENRGLVARLAVTEQLLRHQATHDHLTGLAGRALLRERLAAAASSGVGKPVPVAIVFVDLDGFKAINDAYGHAAGDHVLVETAQRLTRLLAPLGDDALAARLSGDEFAILLTRDAAAEAADTAHDILDVIQRPIAIEGLDLRVGGSLGVASTSSDALEPSALLRAADEAMYQAKRLGKGGIHVAGGGTR